MHLVDKYSKDQMGTGSFFRSQATFAQIPADIIDQADACEIWGTSFKDAGEDYCEFRFFKDSNPLRTFRVNGY